MIVYLVGVLIVLIGFIIGALSLCKTVKEADVLEAELLSKETFSEDAFISGIEFAIDWQLEIPEEDLTNCPNCNTKLGKDDTFCTKCGVKIKE